MQAFGKILGHGQQMIGKHLPTVNSSAVPASLGNEPQLSARDIFRFRKQRGVNLGSWFVLERWIAESPFARAISPGQSDLDVARGSDARNILERHWDNWIKDEDWQWLAERGFNTVRIPIGYYHLSAAEPQVLYGTDFDRLNYVFEGAWWRIERAIATAERYGFGVLIDLHAAPGGQNGDAHSGTSSGTVNFWSPQNLSVTLIALRFLVNRFATCPHVVGLELLNEPANNNSLQGWYESTLRELRSISADFPIHIGDAWDTQWYCKVVGGRSDFVILDHHLYRCFIPADHAQTGDQHAHALRHGTLDQMRDFATKAKGNMVVGEWSAALNPRSLGSGDAGEHDRQRRVFAQAQLDLYEECCAGWFFWTYKKEHGWDAGWCLKDAVRAEIMPGWVGRRRTGRPAVSDPGRRDTSKADALRRHAGHWSAYPGHYEHWRFEDGFSMGWEDAYLFTGFSHGSSVSELGFQGEWIRRRVGEHVNRHGSSSNIWEFEHGFKQGYEGAIQTYFSS